MPNKEKFAERVYGFMLGVLAAGVVIGAMVLFVLVFTGAPRTTEAQQYDQKCLAEPTSKPLTECKE